MMTEQERARFAQRVVATYSTFVGGVDGFDLETALDCLRVHGAGTRALAYLIAGVRQGLIVVTDDGAHVRLRRPSDASVDEATVNFDALVLADPDLDPDTEDGDDELEAPEAS